MQQRFDAAIETARLRSMQEQGYGMDCVPIPVLIALLLATMAGLMIGAEMRPRRET